MQPPQKISLHCNLQDQVVLVKDGASGPGAALCHTLASHSARVRLADVRADNAHVRSQRLASDMRPVQSLVCDVLSLPEHTLVADMIVLTMREASWP